MTNYSANSALIHYMEQKKEKHSKVQQEHPVLVNMLDCSYFFNKDLDCVKKKLPVWNGSPIESEQQPYVYINYLNPFSNKPWFLCVCSKSILKTL